MWVGGVGWPELARAPNNPPSPPQGLNMWPCLYPFVCARVGIPQQGLGMAALDWCARDV